MRAMSHDLAVRRRTLARHPARVAMALIMVLLLTVMGAAPLRMAVAKVILYGPDYLAPTQESTHVVVRREVAPGRVVVSSAPVRKGAVQEGRLVSAALRGAARTYEIYLPPGYFDGANAARRYPVLYLLHGAPGMPTDWVEAGHAATTMDLLLAQGLVRPFIIVMPDGNGGMLRDSQYVNSWNGQARVMDYLAYDVVPTIDARYRTLPDRLDRAIGGTSEGGYGAYNVGLHHPELFNTLISISGYFRALRSEVFGANDPFGHDQAFQRANSPEFYAATVPGVRHMHLFVAASAEEGNYTRWALQFTAALRRAGIPYTPNLHHPTGLALFEHYWPYWRLALQDALVYCSQSFGH